MVFTSLQCIKNTYKYTFEKTTLFSKNYYNILFLYYSKYLFIFENLLTTFFYAVGKRFKKFKKISNKFKKYPLKYSINNYYFFTKPFLEILSQNELNTLRCVFKYCVNTTNKSL